VAPVARVEEAARPGAAERAAAEVCGKPENRAPRPVAQESAEEPEAVAEVRAAEVQEVAVRVVMDLAGEEALGLALEAAKAEAAAPAAEDSVAV
jgi:hypothetical protein